MTVPRRTLPDGKRCVSTRALELDHIRPFALGGESTVENLRVACRACNLLAARRVFGDAVVDRYAGRKDRLRGSAADHGRRLEGPSSVPPPRQDAPALIT